MASEPLPRNYDYQGIKRCLGYVRGVTAVRCGRCKTSGIDPVPNDPTNVCGNFLDASCCDTGVPVCRACGGYGDVPPGHDVAVSVDVAQEPIVAV